MKVPQALVGIGLMATVLTGCSSDPKPDDAKSTTPSVTRTSSTSPSNGATSSSSTEAEAPTSSGETSSDNIDPSGGNTDASKAQDDLAAALNKDRGQSTPSATKAPRGGSAGGENTSNASLQIANFLQAYFTSDTRNDGSEADAAYRARVYATPAYRAALGLPMTPSNTFAEAKKHNGYTTVSVKPSAKGQTEGGDHFRTECKDVTTVWKGDGGWKGPTNTITVCVTAIDDADNQSSIGWRVDKMEVFG